MALTEKDISPQLLMDMLGEVYKNAYEKARSDAGGMQARRGSMLPGITQKAITAPTYSAWGHGNGGLFAQPGVEPQWINAVQLPADGLWARLPEYKTNKTRPLYGILSGVGAGTSTNPPANACGDWGTGGLISICRQDAVLGRKGMGTEVFDLARMGELNDRADMQDFSMIGNPLEGANSGYAMNLFAGGADVGSDFLNKELAKLIFEMAVNMEREFAPDVWTDVPGTAADAYRLEYMRGMEYLINTGYRDAITGTACASVDSDIINFATFATGGNNITTVAGAGDKLVQLLSSLVMAKEKQAREQRLDPVGYAFYMSTLTFWGVTEIWACSYLTNRCQTTTSGMNLNIDATEQVRMREEMRAGNFLWINGKRYEVVLDDTMPQTQPSAGVFTGDIYLIAQTIRGNFPAIFKTYFDFNAPGAAGDALRQMGQLAYGSSVSPDGKYLMNLSKENNCYKLQGTFRPGLVVRTPFLDVRITNVKVQPTIVPRSWDPSAPSFYVNGGTQVGYSPSYYTPHA